MQPDTLTPLQRRVLCAANHRDGLRRTRGGYTGQQADTGAEVFNVRTLRLLERNGLIEFDDPAFPRIARLTEQGKRLAAADAMARLHHKHLAKASKRGAA